MNVCREFDGHIVKFNQTRFVQKEDKMQTLDTLRRFSPNVVLLALLIALGAGGVIVIAAQNALQVPAQTRLTNAAAEQDARMVLQELERERLDQLNASSDIAALRERAAAAQDLQMVMHELERERFPQVYAKSVGAASMSCLDPRVGCDR
jgi:hypothetical protein